MRPNPDWAHDKERMLPRVLLTLLVFAASRAAAQTVHCAARAKPPAGRLAAPDVRDAPTQVVVDGVEVSLRADVALDISPSLLTPCRIDSTAAIRGFVTLVTTRGQRMPRSLHADSVWLVFGDSSWGRPLAQPDPPRIDSEGRELARGSFVAERTDSTVRYFLLRGPPRALSDNTVVVVVRLMQGTRLIGRLRAPPHWMSRVL